jgi:hypothetical protein
MCSNFLRSAASSVKRRESGKVVAFVDMLGFKNYILKGDPTFAYMLLNDFHAQIQTRITDSSLRRATGSDGNTRQTTLLREAYGIDSFEEFHPFSDSVFIASTNPDLFILQISTLLVDSFMFTADAFDREVDSDKITRLQVKYPTMDSRGKVRIEEATEVRYPILLRGGIGYNDAKVAHIPGLTLGKPMMNATLIGPGVIAAYEIEQLHLKGPRIVCDELFAKQVSKREAKLLLHPIPNTKMYDILWPAAHYFDAGGEADVKAKIHEFLSRAVNLWKAFAHLEFGIHYYGFLKLVAISTLQYFKGTQFETFVGRILEDEIKAKSLTLYRDDLFRS